MSGLACVCYKSCNQHTVHSSIDNVLETDFDEIICFSSKLVIMKDTKLYVDDRVKIGQASNRSTTDVLPIASQPAETVKMPRKDFEMTNRIALDYIWPTVPIGFLVLGTVANLLSIIVFRRREMKKFSSFCYFFYLNCVNLAVLYVTMVRVMGDFNFHVDIRSLSLVRKFLLS